MRSSDSQAFSIPAVFFDDALVGIVVLKTSNPCKSLWAGVPREALGTA